LKEEGDEFGPAENWREDYVHCCSSEGSRTRVADMSPQFKGNSKLITGSKILPSL